VTTIGITVNARAVKASVEPRTHLADFLRDHLNLTGTHLGCEHGVCGACTLLLDGMPGRSCITFAAACNGAQVTTIEGLDDDEIATELRAAFTREHALQCGYCTPGILISARDLVLRLDTADERAIRIGLSGNLCRCTGYVGIVRAVRSVIENRRKRGVLPMPGAGRARLGPVGASNGRSTGAPQIAPPVLNAEGEHPEQPMDGSTSDLPDFVPDKVFDDHFTVRRPPDEVFELFGDVRRIATCLPGVSLTAIPSPERVEGVIRVKLGPVVANFRGTARIERDRANRTGRIVGIGSDQRSRSSTQGEILYRLLPIEHGAATRVEISLGYGLRGMLAQIAREGLVRDLATRLTADFARNLDQELSGVTGSELSRQARSVNGLTLIFDVLRMRARRIANRVWGQ
jgi:aerobic carbon-monoxide dehydrogenase small subunit